MSLFTYLQLPSGPLGHIHPLWCESYRWDSPPLMLIQRFGLWGRAGSLAGALRQGFAVCFVLSHGAVNLFWACWNARIGDVEAGHGGKDQRSQRRGITHQSNINLLSFSYARLRLSALGKSSMCTQRMRCWRFWRVWLRLFYVWFIIKISRYHSAVRQG